ncbi:hypothetical protein E4U54_005764, partial [Claviceps lovelessii]
MDLSLLQHGHHRPGAQDAGSPSSLPMKSDVDSPSSLASPTSIVGPTHSYPRHPAPPRDNAGANLDYRELSGERSQYHGEEPSKKKQKRNKPTLSCHECVERKTKTPGDGSIPIPNIADRGAIKDHHASSRGAVALSTGLLSHVPYSVTKASNVFGIGSEYPFANYWTCDGGLGEVISVLPDKQEADVLVARYFECVDPIYPMLHRQTFYADYEHFWRVRNNQNNDLEASFVALIFVILALGTQFVTSPSADKRKQTAEFYASASNQALRVSSFLSTASLRSIQAMVLMTYFLINDNHASDGWAFAGILIRQAYAMGLHRDPNI